MENKNQSLPAVQNQMDKEELKHILGGVEVRNTEANAAGGCIICGDGCSWGCYEGCKDQCKDSNKESSTGKYDKVEPKA